ncbi:MAG: ABC transporter substrate-binding protein [Streptosporangiales bacterium]|nr:ABC transporter substrate-binding protein [Streptosporangiales bacterium]
MKSMSFGPAEKSTINVGVVPAMDSAGFFVAQHDGLFAKEGLTVNYTPQASSETAIAQQQSGKLDISGGNYVSYIQAAMKGTPVEVVAEASIMKQGSQVVFTMPNSGIKSLSQLQGHMLGVNAPGNIDYLLSASTLQENGVNVGGVQFPTKPIPFPEMGPMLKKNQIAAATMPEPFASLAEQQLGAVPIADLNQGATQNFPIEGYVVTKQWAQQNPNTLKRFLAALEAGQEIADTNRSAVEQAFEALKGPADGQVASSIASVMALNNYPIGIDPTRIQRVSNVMQQFGQEGGRSKPFNVNSMLMPSSEFDFAPFESNETSSSS